MALVTILSHFPCTRVHSRFTYKHTIGQISIFGKIGNKNKTKIRAPKLLVNKIKLRITVISL